MFSPQYLSSKFYSENNSEPLFRSFNLWNSNLLILKSWDKSLKGAQHISWSWSPFQHLLGPDLMSRVPGVTSIIFPHLTQTPVWIQPPLIYYQLHSFKPSWHCSMIFQEVKALWCLLWTEPTILHFWPPLYFNPVLIWRLGHLACRESIGSSMLVARCIIKQEKTSCEVMSFGLKDVDHVLHLLK